MTDWIEHDGKGMPVNGEEFVDVKFRDGEIFGTFVEARVWHATDPSHLQEESNWIFSDPEDDNDIVAYRVHSVAPAGAA